MAGICLDYEKLLDNGIKGMKNLFHRENPGCLKKNRRESCLKEWKGSRPVGRILPVLQQRWLQSWQPLKARKSCRTGANGLRWEYIVRKAEEPERGDAIVMALYHYQRLT